MDETPEEIKKSDNTDEIVSISGVNLICKVINDIDPSANINCDDINLRFESGELNYEDAIKEIREHKPKSVFGSVIEDDTVEDVIAEEDYNDTSEI